MKFEFKTKQSNFSLITGNVLK